MENKKRLFGSAALFFAALIWGSSFVVVKDVLNVFPPLILMGIRFSAAFVLLSLFCIRKYLVFDKKDILAGLLLGVILFGGHCLQTYGARDTTPGKNAFLTTVYCVIVPFIYWATDKKRPGIYGVIAAFICIAGIGLISLDSGLSIHIGDALSLSCGIFFAIHIVVISKLANKKYDIIAMTMLQFGFAAILSWAAGLLFEEMPTSAISTGSILAISYLALMPTLVAAIFQSLGQKHTSPAGAAVLMSLESVLGVAFSVLFYGEELTPRLIAGFLLVFAAVITSETKLSFLKNFRKRNDAAGEPK